MPEAVGPTRTTSGAPGGATNGAVGGEEASGAVMIPASTEQQMARAHEQKNKHKKADEKSAENLLALEFHRA